MADNNASSWNTVWGEIFLGLGRKNSADKWKRTHFEVLNQLRDIDFESEVNALFLGGSHSITASTYLGVISTFEWRRTGLVVLDAHPDCCSKADWPIHSDWLRWLVEYEYILPENILIVGLRQIEKSEKEFLEKYNIAHYRIDSFSYYDNLQVYFDLKRYQKLAAIYLSIDIDVASGAFAPGTGCPSPGGLTDTELINLVKQLKAALPNLKAADIVEINPLNWWRKKILRYDATVDLGVKLIKEIIS